MESYLVEVIDEDNESSVVMNFADSIQELIDNIVCMEQFVFITNIKRVSDNKEIKLTKDVTSIALPLKIRSKPIMYNISLKFSLMTNEKVFQLC